MLTMTTQIDEKTREALLLFRQWRPIAAIIEGPREGFWGIIKATFWAAVMLTMLLVLFNGFKLLLGAVFEGLIWYILNQ